MGVPHLDEMLGGGLPRKYSVLVAGPCGSGKSILAAAFLAEGARCGETGVIRVLADLIDISRVHTGKLRLERREIELAIIVDAAIDTRRPAMDARRQHFDVRPFSHSLLVPGGPVRLTQIVSNLLDNASKYTPEGGAIEFSVAVAGEDVVMIVSDRCYRQ